MSRPLQPIDAVAWFAGFSAQDRATLVKALLHAFHGADPDWMGTIANCRAGKTARLEALVPMPDGTRANVGVHLHVEDGDTRLLKSFIERAMAETLLFERGSSMITQAAEHQAAWIAAIGLGSVAILTVQDELMLAVSKRLTMEVPVQVIGPIGSRFDLPDRDGMFLMLFEGHLNMLAAYGNVRREEISAARTAPMELGLLRFNEHLLFLCARMQGIAPAWSDLPFAISILKPEHRRLKPPEMNGSLQIPFMLMERHIGRAAVLRPFTLPRHFASVLLDLIETQQDLAGNYSEERYLADIRAAQSRWPTPAAMKPDFLLPPIVVT